MRLRRVIPSFVFGVSIGLIIGIGFFVFKFNDIFNKLKDTAKDHITVIEQPVKHVREEESTVKKKDRERFKINLKKSREVNYKEVDSIISEDSNISVATDVLLTVKTLKIIRIGDNISEGDTTGADAPSSIPGNDARDLYFVEFWKTPLNTKGYRFTKNKILLYGFMDYSNLLLYELDNTFYIKSNEQVYKIFYGGEFRKLQKVQDTELLAKLN